jgi:hypothetical protein
MLAAVVLLCLVQLGTAHAQTQPSTQKSTADSSSPTIPSETDTAPAVTTPTPYKITVGKVKRAHGRTEDDPVVAGLGEEIVVTVNNLKEEIDRQEAANEDANSRLDPNKLTLFLDDAEIKKLYPESVNLSKNELKFNLRRDADSKQAWNSLLTKPTEPRRSVKVSVGPEGKTAWDVDVKTPQNFMLQVYYPNWLKVCVVLFLIALAIFLWLARRGNIIRDSQPPEPPVGAMKPYSLARTQVAWWFFVILGSFMFIGLVTWDYNTITTSSLVLLGIGAGTGLGAAMVDSNKHESASSDLQTLKPRQAKLVAYVGELSAKIKDVETKSIASPATATPEELAALGGWRTELAAKDAELEQLNVKVADAESARSKPVSEGFINDVLSDVNGVTFHRFQIVVWTVVLGFIFILSVWNHLQMPEFDDKVLALMGISAGTYLGFKIPERQAEPEPTPPVDGGEAGAGGGGVGGQGGGGAVEGGGEGQGQERDV